MMIRQRLTETEMASQAGRRAKNKFGLKLNYTPETVGTCENPPAVPENIDQQLAKMTIDDTQKTKLKSFLDDKSKIHELKKEDFTRLDEVGAGSAGVVYRVRHIPTDITMAQKIIRIDIKPTARTQIIRELQVLHECNSPYIVGYFGAFQDGGDIYMLMEYMDCGSLDKIAKRIRRVPENNLSKITSNILQGLSYLRLNHQVIHRDVKPSNVLLNTDGEVKICDFGVSGKLINSMANSFVGTRSYMAPERLQGARYTVRSDVWSVGIMVVELAVGIYPYPPLSEDKLLTLLKDDSDPINDMEEPPDENLAIFELLDFIVHDEPPTLKEPYFSEEICDFVVKCLKKHPGERADLDSLLNHQYITKHKDHSIIEWVRAIKKKLQS